MERLVPASPERVFRAWTDPAELARWWGPAGVRCRSAAIDLRVGGDYRIENEFADGSVVTIVGAFEAIERPHLLIYSWTVELETSPIERVTVRFEEHGQGTLVGLQHDRIPSKSVREQHEAGWLGCLDGLTAYLR